MNGPTQVQPLTVEVVAGRLSGKGALVESFHRFIVTIDPPQSVSCYELLSQILRPQSINGRFPAKDR